MNVNVSTATTPRPIPLQGDLGSLPDALKPLTAEARWVVWRYEWVVNKRGEGKWTKPPFQARQRQRHAKNNDPSTWSTYVDALAAYRAGECDGIGFCLQGSEFSAFDIDKCRDRETGQIAPEAMKIVDDAVSYTEISPSGTGLRVIGYAAELKKHRRQKLPNSDVEVESYADATRYITITGNPLPGTWPNLADITRVMVGLVAQLDGVKQEELEVDGPERGGSKAEEQKADKASDSNSARRQDDLLPRALVDLIENGPPQTADHSNEFHHAVCWLADCGWSAARIEAHIAGKPIVPARYANRLAGEIARSLHKRSTKPSDDAGARADWSQSGGAHREQTGQQVPPPFELQWHGQQSNRKPREWLVENLIPKAHTGILSGQWGTFKTFNALDLAASVMTGTPFAGREVLRRGGVLFIAAEGAFEIPVRLQGLVDHKLGPLKLSRAAAGNPIDADLERLPFAWIEETPSLKTDFDRLVAASQSAAAHIREQFGLPLALTIIDTYSATANLKSGDDSAENQFIMNRLVELNRKTGAFVLVVDHFGKDVSTGTRGASSKEGAVDVVLALLAERDIAGNISNTRMALRKLRGGRTGAETSFNAQEVDLGNGETTCIIDWREELPTGGKRTDRKAGWSKSTKILRAAMAEVLLNKGRACDPFGDGKLTVKVVALDAVRAEFEARYPADADDANKRADTKRKAFKRAVKDALERDLIGSREIDGIDHIWLVNND